MNSTGLAAATWAQTEADARQTGIRLFGAGRFAQDVARALHLHGIRVHAFLTSGSPAQNELNGIPVLQANSVDLNNAPVWVGVFNREAHSDYATLKETLTNLAPDIRIVWPQAYYGLLADSLGFRFWQHPLEAYAESEHAIAQARALLADDASKAAFDAVLAFRTQTATFSIPPQPQPGTQYLPTWLQKNLHASGISALRLIDGGAYRGETIRELGSLIPIEEAWTFEPDSENYLHLVANLSDLPIQLTHIPAGLSHASGFASFTPGQGEASRLSDQGSHRVPVVALDECLHLAQPNFIKFDLEGHEMAALAGSQKTIQKYRPTMAIAGYHRWDDLWNIPIHIAKYGMNYQIRLMLHGHNTFDAVFYAN